jgi:hypothetical protein
VRHTYATEHEMVAVTEGMYVETLANAEVVHVQRAMLFWNSRSRRTAPPSSRS